MTAPRCEPPAEHRGKRWHWVSFRGEEPGPAEWRQEGCWGSEWVEPKKAYELGYRYVAPCEPPRQETQP